MCYGCVVCCVLCVVFVVCCLSYVLCVVCCVCGMERGIHVCAFECSLFYERVSE